MALTNFELIINYNGIIYNFYTWTSKEYFYDKTALSIKYQNYILYIPCIPVTDKTENVLNSYMFNIRINKDNSLYSFLYTPSSIKSSETRLQDKITFTGRWQETNTTSSFYYFTVKIDVGTPQRIGMRYKYYITTDPEYPFYFTDMGDDELYNKFYGKKQILYNSWTTGEMIGDGNYNIKNFCLKYTPSAARTVLPSPAVVAFNITCDLIPNGYIHTKFDVNKQNDENGGLTITTKDFKILSIY